MSVIEGRDPATGQVLRAEVDGERIIAVHRLAARDPGLPWLIPGLIDL